jgi:hypothetical protein
MPGASARRPGDVSNPDQGQTLLVVGGDEDGDPGHARVGLVKSLKVKQGQTVERDQLLVEIVEAPG